MGLQRKQGMTLVELLIAMAILGIVLVVTSSGIVQSLQVNRLAEDATNTQSKLRRITEVMTQELRAAVLGGISDFPVVSSSNGISFMLLTGDGGVQVLPSPGNSFINSNETNVYAPDATVLQEMLGRPALIINGAGQAMPIPQISNITGNNQKVGHSNCKISIPFTSNTRLYGVDALGFSFDPSTGTLHQVTIGEDGRRTVPFAFGLTDFDIAYEYVAAANTIVRSGPWLDNADTPQPVFVQGGDTYELSRLRVLLASAAEGNATPREYVTYIELTGLGNNQRPLSSIVACNSPGGGGGPGHGGSQPSDPGGGSGDDGEDEDDEDDRGGGPGKGGPNRNCNRLFEFLGWCER